MHSEHLLDVDFTIGPTRHNRHNSRQKKYSSVSSRQREGGSLPSNVNCNLCPYEDPFLIDFVPNSTKKNDKTIAQGILRQDGGICLHNSAAAAITNNIGASVQCSAEDSNDGKISHTVIEIETDETRHLLAHDSLAQVKNLNVCESMQAM